MSVERLIAILEDRIQECESEGLESEQGEEYAEGYSTALRWMLDFVEEELLREGAYSRGDETGW